MQTLERHAFPTLGAMPVHRIRQADVLRVLEPIWTKKPETARRVRQRIRTVLAWALAQGYIDSNPADERIDPALPRMPKVKAHLRALDYREVPAAVAVIDAVPSITSGAALPAIHNSHRGAQRRDSRGALVRDRSRRAPMAHTG